MSEIKYRNIIADDNSLVPVVPDVPLWNETMICTSDDPVTGISSSFYIGRWWGKPTTLRQMVTFLLPGDRGLFARNYGPCPKDGPPSVAGLTMEPIGPCKIRYTYDGPMELRKQSKVAQDGVGTGPSVRVEMDFTFSSKLPIWDMHANDTHGDEGDLMFPGGHMEQLGGVSGTVKFNGETITIKDSPTIRDHSRGVRDFIRHHFHLWINCQFPSGWGFCGFRANVRGQSEPAMNTAALMKDGKVIPAMLETNGQTVPGSDIWQPFEVTLKPEGMKPIHIKVVRLWQCYHIGMYDPADVYWGAPACADDPKATWSMEQAMEVRVDGETGFGHLERCNRDIVVDDHWRSMCVPGKMDR